MDHAIPHHSTVKPFYNPHGFVKSRLAAVQAFHGLAECGWVFLH